MKTVGIAVLGVAFVAIGGFAISSFLNGRDDAAVHSSAGPGEARTAAGDLGAAADVGVPGNIVLLYSAPGDRQALQALAADVGGPASPELEQAGQAVVVRRAPQADGIVAVSATRVLRASSPQDPQVRAFVESWLGDADDA